MPRGPVRQVAERPYDVTGPDAFADVGVGGGATAPSGQDAGEAFGATFVQTADGNVSIDDQEH